MVKKKTSVPKVCLMNKQSKNNHNFHCHMLCNNLKTYLVKCLCPFNIDLHSDSFIQTFTLLMLHLNNNEEERL